jgi:hypothetical protein
MRLHREPGPHRLPRHDSARTGSLFEHTSAMCRGWRGYTNYMSHRNSLQAQHIAMQRGDAGIQFDNRGHVQRPAGVTCTERPQLRRHQRSFSGSVKIARPRSASCIRVCVAARARGGSQRPRGISPECAGRSRKVGSPRGGWLVSLELSGASRPRPCPARFPPPPYHGGWRQRKHWRLTHRRSGAPQRPE